MVIQTDSTLLVEVVLLLKERVWILSFRNLGHEPGEVTLVLPLSFWAGDIVLLIVFNHFVDQRLRLMLPPLSREDFLSSNLLIVLLVESDKDLVVQEIFIVDILHSLGSHSLILVNASNHLILSWSQSLAE